MSTRDSDSQSIAIQPFVEKADYAQHQRQQTALLNKPSHTLKNGTARTDSQRQQQLGKIKHPRTVCTNTRAATLSTGYPILWQYASLIVRDTSSLQTRNPVTLRPNNITKRWPYCKPTATQDVKTILSPPPPSQCCLASINHTTIKHLQCEISDNHNCPKSNITIAITIR